MTNTPDEGQSVLEGVLLFYSAETRRPLIDILKMAGRICYIVAMIPAASRKTDGISLPKQVFSSLLTASFTVLVLLAGAAPPATAEDHPLPTEFSGTIINGEDCPNSLERLNKEFSLSPGDGSIRRRLTAAYADMGKMEFKHNRFQEAAVFFRNAQELSPDNQEYGMLLGIALYRGKNFVEAAAELERSRRNGGDNLPLLFYLGRAYLESGNPSRALSTWERALMIEPDIRPLRATVEKMRRTLATN